VSQINIIGLKNLQKAFKMLKSNKKRVDLILIDKKKDVKKHEKLVTAKFEFSTMAIKILTLLISAIQEEDNPNTIYKLHISDLFKIYDNDYHSLYDKVKSAINEIMEKTIWIEDEKRWKGYHIIRNPVIEKGSGIIEIKFDEEIFPILLETKKNFLQYRVENILVLDSKYAIRLYEILKNAYNLATRYNKTKKVVEEEISLDYLKERLLIPKSYRYPDIKRRVILTSQKQINENTDIQFEFKEIKQGRSVKKIVFLISKNEKNLAQNEENNDNKYINKSSPLENIKQKLKDKKLSLSAFSKELQKLQNVEITNVIPNNEGKLLKTNEYGMLEFDGKELDNIKANAIRRILFSNPDLIGKFIEIDEEIKKLKEKYEGNVIEFMLDNLYYAIGVKNIERVSKNKFRIKGVELLRDIDNFYVDFNKEALNKLIIRNKLNTAEIDEKIKHNNHIELKKLTDFFEKNKEQFEKWVDELEGKSIELSNKLIQLEEDSDEYIKIAKEIVLIDKLMIKANEMLNKRQISELDKKFVLKKFQEYLKK
jgi:plasmid replication initiation protein